MVTGKVVLIFFEREVLRSEAIKDNSFNSEVHSTYHILGGGWSDLNDMSASSFKTPCWI